MKKNFCSVEPVARTNHGTALILQLCPKCGLCCNGVLFADVRLKKGDDGRRLTDLGLPLKKKTGGLAFPQPCTCFDGAFCRIYAERPTQCRAFECGLLKRVQAGEMEVNTAKKKITKARRLVEKVRRLLHRLGDHNEHLPLTRRYARVMREPIDLSGPQDAGEGRGELMLAENELMHVLQRDFLK